MSNIKSICLRFNTDKPLHRQAWEYLQGMNKDSLKSYTHAAALAIVEYFQRYYKKADDPYFETREREEQFIAEMVSAVERAVDKAMPNFMAAYLANLILPVQSARNIAPHNAIEETEDAIAEVDLDFIGG